jgi:hypothetical protein
MPEQPIATYTLPDPVPQQYNFRYADGTEWSREYLGKWQQIKKAQACDLGPWGELYNGKEICP